VLAISQETNEELKKYNQGKSGLLLEKIAVPGTRVAVLCDTSMGTARPFLTSFSDVLHSTASTTWFRD